MDIAQIRSFLALAETLHFGRAAERLHLSQPALSLQIRALEAGLGVRLFERNRRKTEITEAGAVFREEAAAALKALDHAAARARAAAGRVGCVRVGFISTAAALVVPPLITRFRATHPEVELEMRHALTAEQIEGLARRDIDIGFFRMPASPGPGIATVEVHRERFRLFLPEGDSLAGKPALSLTDLDGREMLIYARRNAPGFHDLLLRMLEDAGASPAALHEANDMSSLMSLGAAGVGAVIAPASVGQFGPPGVVRRDLDGLPPSVVVMAHRADERHPAVRAFVDLVASARDLSA
ncbi:MAG: LysR family transcriptional regulator [Afipia sp.]|nr:MAG: LysR family transcriptional regulator [Afipia sp.]